MKHEGYTPGLWRIEPRTDEAGRTMPHIDAVSYGINAERIVIAENLFVRDAALIADAPRLAEENERLRALLRLAEIDLASFVRQDSTELLGKIRLQLDGTAHSSGILRKAALAGRDSDKP